MKGGIGVETMEANAALRNRGPRVTGGCWRLARDTHGEDLARLDRKRKRLRTRTWTPRPSAERPTYKPEHAVDLDTGAVVAAELHPPTTRTHAGGGQGLEAVDAAPTAEDPAECVTDKGYHSRSVLKALDDGPWKTHRPAAGTATGRPAGQSPTTGPGCYRAWPRKPSIDPALLCAQPRSRRHAPMAARARERTSDTCSMSPPQSSPDAQTDRAGTPREAVAGGYGCICVLIALAGAVLVAQMVLIVSGETAFVALCFAVE